MAPHRFGRRRQYFIRERGLVRRTGNKCFGPVFAAGVISSGTLFFQILGCSPSPCFYKSPPYGTPKYLSPIAGTRGTTEGTSLPRRRPLYSTFYCNIAQNGIKKGSKANIVFFGRGRMTFFMRIICFRKHMYERRTSREQRIFIIFVDLSPLIGWLPLWSNLGHHRPEDVRSSFPPSRRSQLTTVVW